MEVNKIVIFIFFVVGNVLEAQKTQLIKIQLNWIEYAEVKVSKNFIVNSILVEDIFLDGHLNPILPEIWDVQNGGVLQNFMIKSEIFEQINNVFKSIIITEKICFRASCKLQDFQRMRADSK